MRLLTQAVCHLQFRAERGVAPAYADVLASRDSVMKNAVQKRQVCTIAIAVRITLGQCLSLATKPLCGVQHHDYALRAT